MPVPFGSQELYAANLDPASIRMFHNRQSAVSYVAWVVEGWAKPMDLGQVTGQEGGPCPRFKLEDHSGTEEQIK
jgi:hypothetical protein